LCVNVFGHLKEKKSIIGSRMGEEWFNNQNVNAYYRFLGVHYFWWICVYRGGGNIIQLVQWNKPMYK
jgi:hypothetical protein